MNKPTAIIIIVVCIIALFLVFSAGQCTGYNKAVSDLEKTGIDLQKLTDKIKDASKSMDDVLNELENILKNYNLPQHSTDKKI
jgi:hypothetical protein